MNKFQIFYPLLSLPTFLFLPLALLAQLSGKVLDENGEPLPYASVYVRNSTNGTAANGNGEFKLTLEKGRHDIVFQYIGYKQRIEQVNIADKPVRLTVHMEPSDLQISEVVITTEDPAYAIMRKAIEKREYYKKRTPEYSCDVYIKGFYKLADAPKKVLGKDVGDMGGILDSNRTGVIYLSESVSKLYVQTQPYRTKEVMISSKVSGETNGFSLNRATLTGLSLYEERITIDREILSPLADNAFAYYRFRLKGRFKDQNGYDVYKIEVIPKRDEDPTYLGDIYIVDEWWNLAGVDLKLTGKAIQQPVLDTLTIKQEFVPVNKPDEWCLLSQLTGLKIKVFGFKVEGFFNCVLSNYDLRPTFGPEIFGRETFKIEKAAGERDSSYWVDTRPVPLTEEESNDYVRKDSLEQIWKSKAYLDSVDHKRNRFKPGNLISGYTWHNSYRRTSISYPSLYQGWQFNPVQGWLINFRPTFRHNDDEYQSRYWEAEGALNYGFSEKVLRGGLRLTRLFESVQYTRVSLSGGVLNEQFDPNKQISELPNLLYALFEKQNYIKLYEKTFVRGSIYRHMAPGLWMDLSAEFAERRPLVNHSNYSFYRKYRDYAPNAPLPAPADEPFFEKHRAFLLELGARFQIGETYGSYPNFRSYDSSGWPQLVVRYTKAVPGVGGSMVDYDLVQLRLYQNNLSMGLFGFSEWSVGAGWFWRNNRVEFMDFYHPLGNQTFIGRPRDYLRGFFLLPYYEFSTDKAYTFAHWRHHFNGWILDKVPLLRKLNWKEAIGVGMYFADEYAWESQRPGTTLPYWELSFGFYNIGIKVIRPLHIDVAAGFYGSRYYRTGLVLGLDI